jgi:omega-amidase
VQDLNLTLIQTELHWQNPVANRAMFAEQIAAQAAASDLILLPEMFATGFTLNAAANCELDDGDSARWLQEMATTHKVTLSGSIVINDGGQYYNRLLWVNPEGEIQHYDKRHLFRMAGEDKKYSAGSERLLVQLGDWRICPLICYDLRFPVWSRGINEYDLLLYVANWPAPRRSAWRTLLPARAVENLCYSAGVNRIGVDGNAVPYAGDSMVTDYLGNIQGDAGDRQEALNVTLSLDKLNAYRDKFPAWKDADSYTLKP